MTRSSFLAFAVLCIASSAALADAPPGVSQQWLDTIQRQIRAREYRFSASDDDAFSAPNRALDLRGRVAAGGVQVTSRTKGEDAFELQLALVRIGRDGSLADVPEGKAALRGERVEIRRDGLPIVEWYTNDERGLEQGWTLAARPTDGAGPLVLELASGGSLRPILRPQDRRIVFVDSSGAARLFYSGLVARDARGLELASRLAVADGRVQIRVSDAGAIYPIVVDPLIQPASWSVESNVGSALFGLSVATAGDVNGDGYSDVIVGSPGELSNIGKAYLYLGSSTGLSTTPIWTGQGTGTGASFGFSVASAGNVNGDAWGDVVIGAPNSGVGGYITVYQGSATGQLINPVTINQAGCFSAALAGTHFGYSVATAGDVDGDGFDEVIAGEPNLPIPPDKSGAVCIYRGSASGVSAGSKWVLTPPITGAGTPTTITQSFFFGTSVSTAGDVNGDGLADVIIGAPSASIVSSGALAVGAAYVYQGISGGAPPTLVWVQPGDYPFHSGDRELFGASVANAGDLNGDGYGDVIVGEPGFHSPTGQNSGAIFVFHGSASGIAVPLTGCGVASGVTSVPAQYCDWGITAGSRFGTSVATAGDLNGDGYADMALGMPGLANDAGGNGAVEIIYGRADGVYQILPQDLLKTSEALGFLTELGTAVATGGDTDGDGFSDLVVGLAGHTNGQTNEGQALLYRGSASAPQTSTYWNFGPGNAARAGDSIATADVNADGRSDIVIGAPGFDNGFTDQGAVFVFDTPISVGPFSPNPSPANATRSYFGLAANAHLGQSVANAGDVNDDGYEDVIVGAPGLDRAYLYQGSSSGLPALATQEIPGPAGSHFGQSVAGAGDVNGDGLGDVVVGAPLDETSAGLADEGVARIYLGNGSGGVGLSIWSAHSGQPGAQLGFTVAGVGDVNRDGFSDVLVGAPFYVGGLGTAIGQVQLYLGAGLGGVSTTPAWTATGGGSPFNHNQIGGDLGYLQDVDADGFSDFWIRSTAYSGLSQTDSVQIYRGQASGVPLFLSNFAGLTAAAGDLNGDGRSDLIVADSNALTVKAFAGPLAPVTQLWSLTGAAGSEFAARVATGDVNGDGIADVLVGSPGVDGGFTDAGMVSLFLGNLPFSEDGVALRTTQTDGACLFCIIRNIALLGRPTSSPALFNLSVVGRSVAGSARLRLESEVKPLGASLDGTALSSTAPVAGIGASLVGLTSSPNALPPGLPRHWRLRLASNNPFFPHSRWLSPFGNGPNESDLRGAADQDADGVVDGADNCPLNANADQADSDADGAGDVCDNCPNAANPRVTPTVTTYLASNPWATLTGGQRDDDHDGYGNRCDAKFTTTGALVGPTDSTQFRASNGKNRALDLCGTSGVRPCAIFDLDEGGTLVGPADLTLFRTLNGKAPGPKCTSCPLACESGTAGTCGPVP